MKFIANDLEEMKKIEEVLNKHGISTKESRDTYTTAEWDSISGKVELVIEYGFNFKAFDFSKKWNFRKMWIHIDNRNEELKEYTLFFLFEELVIRVKRFTNLDEFSIQIYD
jgi:hypothetical protein